MDRLPKHTSDFTERNKLWSDWMGGKATSVAPPAIPSFEHYREQWLAKRGRTPQDYLPVTSNDTSSLHCVSAKGRDSIHPVGGTDSRLGRSRELYNSTLARDKLPWTPVQACTNTADRAAASAFEYGRESLNTAQSYSQAEDAAVVAKPLSRWQGAIEPHRETLEDPKRPEAGVRLLRHMNVPQVGYHRHSLCNVNIGLGEKSAGALQQTAGHHYDDAYQLFTRAAELDPT